MIAQDDNNFDRTDDNNSDRIGNIDSYCTRR